MLFLIKYIKTMINGFGYDNLKAEKKSDSNLIHQQLIPFTMYIDDFYFWVVF